jgi:hypothetical protein
MDSVLPGPFKDMISLRCVALVVPYKVLSKNYSRLFCRMYKFATFQNILRDFVFPGRHSLGYTVLWKATLSSLVPT